ncbi:MAG: 50S ribosomal protein L11 methyltransferase [Myxococcota bacterium]
MSDEISEHWYRILILVDEADAERASSVLWNLGAAGVEVRDRETFVEEDDAPPLPEGTAELSTFFSADAPVEPDTLFARVEEAMTAEGIGIETGDAYEFTDTSWKTGWKDYFKPVELSPRVIVGPPWEDFEAPEGGTRLVIEPGMAFGTGGHETTQLCATILDEMLRRTPGLDILDVGCGSAILSMLARRLRAGDVIGVDHDPTAVEVARENLEVNDLEGQVDLSTTPVEDVEGTFDVVVANILTHILLDIRPGLQARVSSDGALILSGITDAQIASIRQAFGGEGWTEDDFRQDGDWCAIVYRRA